MLRRKLLFLGLLLAGLMVISLMTSAQTRVPPSTPTSPWPASLLGKVEPDLLKQLAQSQKPVRFLAYLEDTLPNLPSASNRLKSTAVRATIVEILQTRAALTQQEFAPLIETLSSQGHILSYSTLWLPNAFVITGDLEALKALASEPGIKRLRLDHQIHIGESPLSAVHHPLSEIPWNISKIEADRAWNAFGITGQGVVVANIDTGVDWLHPALQTSYRGYNPKGLPQHEGNWFDATGQGALYPVDGHGHGTHTMGTILGQGGIGVAPGARWIAVRAFNTQGVGYESWIHSAFQWILAPDGDPALAPDVVNNSWGSQEPASEIFRPDIQALRAAGIVPVFSAGNNGPNPGTISSPASLPEAFAVGATDSDDEVADFSGRGPSPWGQVKPDVVAPGVSIYSALPGGTYGLMSGTSMATPHATGLAALLLQADPTLTITETEEVIRHTAVPIGEEVPNNGAGWGRIDACQAVLAVTAAGFISGTLQSTGGNPIPWGNVKAVPSEGGTAVIASVDKNGHYVLALPPGLYDVTASAFAYQPQTLTRVKVVTGSSTIVNFSLSPYPTGTLRGYILEAGTGKPLSATVEVLNTPVTTTAAFSTGLYSLALPTGSYTLVVKSPGHRIGRARNISVTAGEVSTQDFSLPTAPSILLVDSGAWYYNSQIEYFQDALEALDYLYDFTRIKHPEADIPISTTLMAYDIVIWSSPQDSPGYIGAWDSLASYLDAGGRLLLTGQDVAFWDGGGSAYLFAPEFQQYLKARFDEDDAGSRNINGIAGGPFEGLSFTITDGDGADNQKYPDAVSVADPDFAAPLLTYDNGKIAAVGASCCLPYRTLFLAFGFEAIADRATRIEVMSRAIDWLMAPGPAVGTELKAQSSLRIGAPGSTVTFTLRLRNTGEEGSGDVYALSISGAEWPAELSASTLTLAPCVSDVIIITVDIPSGLGFDEADVFTVTATSGNSPSAKDAVTLTAKTPAPILLLDDDRWYDQQEAYRAALEAAGISYDVWDLSTDSPEALSLPFIKLYPAAVWFTGYDWYEPLTEEEEATLSAYLDGGGKLVLSSQDYLYVHPESPFWGDYLGVADYINDFTTTVAYAPEIPLDMEPAFIPFEYPFRNWSDALIPNPEADAIWLGGHGLPIGIATTRTVFCAFPLEALPLEVRSQALEQSLAHLLNPLKVSFTSYPQAVAPGSQVRYQVALTNTAESEVAFSSLYTIPAETSFVAINITPSVGSARFDSDHNALLWEGNFLPGQSALMEYQVQVSDSISSGAVLLASAEVRAGPGYVPPLRRYARTYINAPDINGTSMDVSPKTVDPDCPFTVTLTLRNEGLAPAAPVTVTFPTFPSLEILTETVQLPAVDWDFTLREGELVVWGSLPAPSEGDVLSCQMALLSPGRKIVPVWLEGAGGTQWRGVYVRVKPWRMILPLIFKGG